MTDFCLPATVLVCGQALASYEPAYVDVCTADGNDRGRFRGWYAAGKPWMEGSCDKNLLQGPWREWSQDGKLLRSGAYHDGKREGEWREPDGINHTVIAQYQHGVRNRWEVYDDKGRKLEEHAGAAGRKHDRYFWESGKLEGEEFSCPPDHACPPNRSWFEDGKLHMIVDRQGADQHLVVFYPDGTKREDYHTVDGEVLRWYPSGCPMFRGQVRHGKTNGHVEYWSEDGQRRDMEFRDGVEIKRGP